MELSKTTPIPLRLDPPDNRAGAPTSEGQAKRVLGRLASQKLFQDNQRVLTQGIRTETANRVRTPLYTQVAREIDDLRARLGEGGRAASARKQAADAQTAAPTYGEASLVPNVTLNQVPFDTAVTKGTVKLSFKVNGDLLAQTRTITIDPKTQTLNDVIASFNAIDVNGARPLNVSFDAASSWLRFDVDSTSGIAVDFNVAGGSSNFLTVVGADARTASRSVTVNGAIADSATVVKYDRLAIGIEGKGSKTFSNLKVSSAALTPDQKVDELVGQLNAGLAGTGVTAVNAGGGKLGFRSSDPAAALKPQFGIRVTETVKAGALSLGALGGITVRDTIVADPKLKAVALPAASDQETAGLLAGATAGRAGQLLPSREVEELALAVNDVASLIERGTASAGLDEDRLLQDLQSAFSGLFNPSSDGALRTFADVGITREDGEIKIDTGRLASLVSDRPQDLAAFVDRFKQGSLSPLLKDGARALQDAGAVGDAESQAAAQGVRVRGEIARLQVRQQMLALAQLNYETFRDRLSRQAEELAKAADTIDRLTPTGRPAAVDTADAVADATAAGGQRPTAFAAGPAPALNSFGMGADKP